MPPSRRSSGSRPASNASSAPELRVRAASDGELARHWPEAKGLLPTGFGREPDRYCVIELRASLGPGDDVPDAPAEIADAVSAIRLATAAPLAGGPGPVRDARRQAVRHSARLADRGDAAAGRAEPAGRVPRPACRGAARAGSRSPTRTRTSPRRSTAGSCRSSSTSPSARSSCGRRSRRCSARRGRYAPRSSSSRSRTPRAGAPSRPRAARRRRGGDLDRGCRGAALARRGAARRRPRRAHRPARPRAARRRRARSASRGLRSPSCARRRLGRARASTPGPPSACTSHIRHEAGTHLSQVPGYVRDMEEARSVLERFERIESMRRANAGPVELLGELRALLREAEAWTQAGRR